MKNNNKYKHLFLKKTTMALDIYLDVFVIDNHEIPNEIQEQIPEVKIHREIQAELKAFC